MVQIEEKKSNLDDPPIQLSLCPSSVAEWTFYSRVLSQTNETFPTLSRHSGYFS
jgi:hypothetical protein